MVRRLIRASWQGWQLQGMGRIPLAQAGRLFLLQSRNAGCVMASKNQTDGMMVTIIDKDTGKARVVWDGESKHLGLPERTKPNPMPETDFDNIDFKK
jgi:hypothetical protein